MLGDCFVLIGRRARCEYTRLDQLAPEVQPVVVSYLTDRVPRVWQAETDQPGGAEFVANLLEVVGLVEATVLACLPCVAQLGFPGAAMAAEPGGEGVELLCVWLFHVRCPFVSYSSSL